MTHLSRRQFATAAVALAASSALTSCQNPFLPLIEEVRAARAQLDRTIADLEHTVEEQRTKLAQDLQELLRGVTSELTLMVDRVDSLVDKVVTLGANLAEKATADLMGAITSIRTLAEKLLNAVQTAVDQEIRQAAQEFDRQRTSTLQQLEAATQEVLRPAIAQLSLAGDRWVGQLNSAVNTTIVRVLGGLVLLAGGIAAAVSVGKGRAAGGIVGGGLAVVGLVLLLAAAPIGRLGQPTVEIPDAEAVCAEMRTAADGLKPYEQPVSRAARAEGAMRVAVAAAPSALRVRNLLVEAPPPATDPRTAAGRAALTAANRCLTWATTEPLAAEAHRVITRSLAVLDQTVFCHTADDCAVLGKACDAFVGVCLDWGYYCDNHGDCGPDRACDLERHRCVSAERPCDTPADCAPDYACDKRLGRCAAVAAIDQRHEPCEMVDAAPNSPCRQGVIGVNADRWVQCVQSGTAGPEVCNGIDDDCNFSTDEGIGRPDGCDQGVGSCRSHGRWSCAGGAWTCALAAPSPEVCDGQDNDCNGVTDDAPPWGTCDAPATGECRHGTNTCAGCVPGPRNPEVCDGLDNDCDGAADPSPICPEVEVYHQEPGDNNNEMTASPNLPTDLIDVTRTHGPVRCGEDEHGRPYVRTSAAASAWSGHGASCWVEGWATDDPYNCQVRVHYKTTQMGSNVWCVGQWFGRPEGAYRR